MITELARDTPSWRGLLRLVDSTPPPTAGTSPPGSGSSPAAASGSRRSFDTLKGQLTLEDHGGRALAGAYARVAARLLALAAAICTNWRTDAPVKRSFSRSRRAGGSADYEQALAREAA